MSETKQLQKKPHATALGATTAGENASSTSCWAVTSNSCSVLHTDSLFQTNLLTTSWALKHATNQAAGENASSNSHGNDRGWRKRRTVAAKLRCLHGGILPSANRLGKDTKLLQGLDRNLSQNGYGATPKYHI